MRGHGGTDYREVPIHPELRDNLAAWLADRRTWPCAGTNPALFLNRRGGRLTTRGARDVLTALAGRAGLDPEPTSAVLRHTFGSTLVRAGHDLVLVAELTGLRRLDTARGYTDPPRSPRPGDRERAIASLPLGR